MDLYTLLDAVPTTLSAKTIHYLTDYGHRVHFDVGELVFREGDQSRNVYIILDGEATVIKNDAFGNSNIIATATRGSVFGEMGVFLDQRRSASITAHTPLSALVLNNADFLTALRAFPDLSLRLFKSLSVKLDGVNEKLANLLNATGMIQLGSYILDWYRGPRVGQCELPFDDVVAHTSLKRRDVINALINYGRLEIITGLEFRNEDRASFQLQSSLMRDYIKRISLKPDEFNRDFAS